MYVWIDRIIGVMLLFDDWLLWLIMFNGGELEGGLEGVLKGVLHKFVYNYVSYVG